MNKSLGGIILIVVLVILGFIIWGGDKSPDTSGDSVQDQTSGNPDSPSGSSASGEGTVVFSFTDETADIQNVNEVHMKVDKIEMHSASKGWVRVSSDDVEYKLMELKAKGENRIYASAKVAADSYSKVRVHVKDVVVEQKDGAKKKAQLPKKELEMDSSIRVNGNATTSVSLDVLADKSLHTTTGGEYVFAPVVKIESRSSATVSTSSDGVVTYSGGSVDSSATLGMDLNGSMQSGFQLDSSLMLDIRAGGTIRALDNAGTVIDGAGTVGGTVGGTVEGTVEGGLNGALGN